MQTTIKERTAVIERLSRLGIGYDDAQRFRRIAMTLHNWHEMECGDGNEYGSWAIEHDETTDKPVLVRHHYGHGQYQDRRTETSIPDREKGALKRLVSLIGKYPHLIEYVQTDPRGASLYLLRRTDLDGGLNIDSSYSRGTAIY